MHVMVKGNVESSDLLAQLDKTVKKALERKSVVTDWDDDMFSEIPEGPQEDQDRVSRSFKLIK